MEQERNALVEKFRDAQNALPFTLSGTNCYCRILNVHDGDTVKAVLPVHDSFHRFSVRLAGIDTCEVKSKNDTIREMAMRARNRLIELVTGKPHNSADENVPFNEEVYLVYARLGSFDKYGRLLAELYPDETASISFSQILLSERLAYPYGGRTKMSEEEQIQTLA